MAQYNGVERERKVQEAMKEMHRKPDSHMALEMIEAITDDKNVLNIIDAWTEGVEAQ